MTQIMLILKTIFADKITGVETFLQALENEASNVGLHVNTKKTELLSFNETCFLKTTSGSIIKENIINNFMYLESEIFSTEIT